MHANLHNSPTVHHVHRCPYHVVMPTMCVCVHRHTYIRAHLTCDEAKFQMKTNTDQPQEVPSIDHHTYIHMYTNLSSMLPSNHQQNYPVLAMA